MKLQPNVYFQMYGSYAYLRDVSTRKNYVFNETVYDILDCLRGKNGCTIDELCSCLLDMYEVDDEKQFCRDIASFTDMLRNAGIIIDDQEKPDAGDVRSAREFIHEMCCREHRLFSATLELTYRCNERCIHCYVDDETHRSEEMNLADYRNLLDQLSELGCMSVLLTGGESTLHPDFLDIAAYVVQKGMLLDIYTNGLYISDEMMDALIQMKPNSISFSLYGGDAEVHDAITCIPGSFDRSLRALMTCKCAGIDTYIKTVVMKQNYRNLEKLFRLGKRLGIHILTSVLIMPSHGGKPAETYRLMDEELYYETFCLSKRYQPDAFYPVEPNKGDRYMCGSGLDQLSFDPYGNVHPCNAHPAVLGNVREMPLRGIWEDSQILKDMYKLRLSQLSPGCETCEYADYCTACMGNSYRENDNRLEPCSDTCMLARALYRAYQE